MRSVEAFSPRADGVLRPGAWRASADAAADAYLAWCEAPPAQRAEAYAVYRAAEEREAAAAADLRLRARSPRRL